MEENRGFIYLNLGLTLVLLIFIAFGAVFFIDRSAGNSSPADELLGVIVAFPRPTPIHDFRGGNIVRIGGVRYQVYSLNTEDRTLGDRLGYLIYGSDIVIIGEVRSFNKKWYWPAKVIQANMILEGQDVWIHDDSILTVIERALP